MLKLPLSLLLSLPLLAAPLPAAPPPAALEAAPKALVVVRDYDDELRVVSAAEQAVALRAAGFAVSLLFEGEGVLNLLPEDARPPHARRERTHNRGALPEARVAAALKTALAEVPFTACAYSARVLGVGRALKAAGSPLSSDSRAPVNFARFLEEGYEIHVY